MDPFVQGASKVESLLSSVKIFEQGLFTTERLFAATTVYLLLPMLFCTVSTLFFKKDGQRRAIRPPFY